MTPETFLDGKVTLWAGDCLDALPRLEEASVDSCVTDPPYHLTSIVKRMSADNAAPVGFGSDGRYRRLSGGFMGKKWDGGDIAFRPETWAAVYRALKPGAHLLAFGGTRTFGRMQVAIEEAGFEIRDCILWLYGSGFPKSHDVSKAIDKAAGAERERIRGVRSGVVQDVYAQDAWSKEFKDSVLSSEPITDEARMWDGFGTALKPACEPIILARKPLVGTVAENVLQHGTGALNIDGCRVATSDKIEPVFGGRKGEKHGSKYGHSDDYLSNVSPLGRWPANVIHDGSDEVVEAFPDTGQSGIAVQRNGGGQRIGNIVYSGTDSDLVRPDVGFADGGSAARFFYTAKADSDDRLGSKHPTVKPLDLMQYLVRLVTPPRGLVLDPFAGTGTTSEAAFREGMRAVLIEREAEYQDDIRRRMKLALGGPDERAREAIKARGLVADAGPLFTAHD